MNGVHTLVFACSYKAQELQVVGNVCEVTEGRTLLAITQVSSGLKKLYILIFSKYRYFHVKIASLANVQSCVTIGLMSNVLPCIVSLYYLSGLAL